MTEEIYRTALRQASATCRGSGQVWIADELDALQREIDLLEVSRDSVAVVKRAREELMRRRGHGGVHDTSYYEETDDD